MSQEHYFQSILERFDLQDCNPARTPLPPASVLSQPQIRNTHLPNTYRSLKSSAPSSMHPPHLPMVVSERCCHGSPPGQVTLVIRPKCAGGSFTMVVAEGRVWFEVGEPLNTTRMT
jgi:hypothetical protein